MLSETICLRHDLMGSLTSDHMVNTYSASALITIGCANF